MRSAGPLTKIANNLHPASWRMLKDVVLYRVKILRKGVDLKFASVEEMGLSPDHAHWFSNSGGPYLECLLRKIALPRSFRAIDIGSGKGGAVFTLAEYFGSAAGLELSSELVETSKRNAQKLGCANVTFIQGDAMVFDEFDCFDFFYLYNPFPPVVLEAFLQNLARSIDRKPRSLVMAYKGAFFHDKVMDSRIFRIFEDYSIARSTLPFRVYMS